MCKASLQITRYNLIIEFFNKGYKTKVVAANYFYESLIDPGLVNYMINLEIRTMSLNILLLRYILISLEVTIYEI